MTDDRTPEEIEQDRAIKALSDLGKSEVQLWCELLDRACGTWTIGGCTRTVHYPSEKGINDG